MRMVRPLSVALFLIIAPIQVSAGQSFWECLKSNLSQWGRVDDRPLATSLFPKIHELPLPPEFIDALRRHPIDRLRVKYQGKKIVIVHGDYIFRKDGEGVQSGFVLNVLDEIFDSAQFKGLKELNDDEIMVRAGMSARSLLSYPIFTIRVADPAEVRGDHVLFGGTSQLSMPILKPANSTSAFIDRGSIRNLFGISPTDVAVSFYSREVGIHPILDSIHIRAQPKVIFASHSLLDTESEFIVAGEAWGRASKYVVRLLSKLREGEISDSKDKRYIIINDTRGRMPFVHAASDLTVIQGPINMFESLGVGTPTVVLVRPEQLARGKARIYLPETFHSMVRVAEATGAGKHVSSREELNVAIREFLGRSRDFPRPAYIPDESGKTPVDRMLDHLQDNLKEQGID